MLSAIILFPSLSLCHPSQERSRKPWLLNNELKDSCGTCGVSFGMYHTRIDSLIAPCHSSEIWIWGGRSWQEPKQLCLWVMLLRAMSEMSLRWWAPQREQYILSEGQASWHGLSQTIACSSTVKGLQPFLSVCQFYIHRFFLVFPCFPRCLLLHPGWQLLYIPLLAERGDLLCLVRRGLWGQSFDGADCAGVLWKAAAADFAQIGFRHVGCKVLCTQYTIQYINVLPFLAYGIWFRNSNMLEQAGRNWNRQMNILEPELLSAFWFPIPRKHPDMEAVLSICAGEHPPLRGARPSTIGSPSFHPLCLQTTSRPWENHSEPKHTKHI